MAIIRVPLVICNGRIEDLSPGDKIKNCTETLKFTFTTPTNPWFVAHNLGKYPSVSVVDGAGNIVHGDITYVDDNTVTITFAKPFTGCAYIN